MMLMTWFLLSVVYTIFNARVVILISNVVTNLDNWAYHLYILLAVCVIQTVISMIRGVTRPLAVHHVFSTLNTNYSDKMLDADVEMFTKYSCAHINTIAHFINNISNAGTMLMNFILNLVNIVVVLVSIYLVGGSMVIPVIGIYLLGACFAKKLFKKFDELDQMADKIKKKRNQELENIVNGFMEVRSFNTQEKHRQTIRNFNHDIYDGRKKRSRIECFTNLSFEVIDTLGLVCVLLYSISKLNAGAINQAQAISLVMYVFRIIDPMASVVDFIGTISETTSMAKDYDKIINYVNKNKPEGNILMDTFHDKIELKEVSFAYDNTSTVLKNINMTIPKGKKVGICGISGAGKSTLFKLINRFYDPSSGELLVDGVPIQQITKGSYRKHLGSVHQENSIFPGSIKENIMYGAPNALESELIEACKRANIYQFICSLPERFDTEVGPRGLKLSGGQKQRIALARLFLQDPEIILFDEATSALDNESEGIIQEAIESLEGKTMITIAHRLSTIRNSDIIYVLGTDGIIESGSHEELLKLNGAYAAMLR